MINDLILLTASMHVENLFDVEKSIKENKDRLKLNLLWVISIDRYNSDIETVIKSLPDLENLLKEDDIKYAIFLSGKPNQGNYGGDMYNDPLKFVKEKLFKEKNAFVYILDDDNIVHPFLFDRVNEISEFNGDNDKIYVLTCVGDYGEICESNSEIFMKQMQYEGYYRIPFQYALDPSQALQTLNLVLSWEYKDRDGNICRGGFPPSVTYDIDLYPYLYFTNKEYFVCHDKIDDFNWTNSFKNTFHNGLRKQEEIEEYIDSLESTDLSSSYIVVQTKEKMSKMFPITSDIAKEVLKKLKK